MMCHSASIVVLPERKTIGERCPLLASFPRALNLPYHPRHSGRLRLSDSLPSRPRLVLHRRIAGRLASRQTEATTMMTWPGKICSRTLRSPPLISATRLSYAEIAVLLVHMSIPVMTSCPPVDAPVDRPCTASAP